MLVCMRFLYLGYKPIAHSHRLYRPSSYYAAKFLVGLPFAVFNILTLVFIVYGMVGFRCG